MTLGEAAALLGADGSAPVPVTRARGRSPQLSGRKEGQQNPEARMPKSHLLDREGLPPAPRVPPDFPKAAPSADDVEASKGTLAQSGVLVRKSPLGSLDRQST